MQEFLINLFGDYGRIIVFLHVISAAFLLGSMLMIRFIIKPALMDIDDEAVRYGRCLRVLERYFRYLAAIMILIISASLTMSVGLGFEYANPTLFSLIHVKEALWVFISFNFLYMYIKLYNSRILYKKREFFEVHENLKLIVDYLMTLNIVLTLIASYIGVIIRGF
jgi:uncharacterized membrane protein